MNKIVLMGRLTKDAEVRKTTSGVSVATFTLALDDKELKNKPTYYFPCIVFGKSADTFVQYIHKGDRVLLNGKLTQRLYQDKNGNKRTAFEVVCENFEFIEPPTKKPEAEAPKEPVPETPTYGAYVEDDLGE